MATYTRRVGVNAGRGTAKVYDSSTSTTPLVSATQDSATVVSASTSNIYAKYVAEPENGYYFTGWMNDSSNIESTSNPYIFTNYSSRISLRAVFAQLQPVTVEIKKGNWDKFRYRSKGPSDSTYGSWSWSTADTSISLYPGSSLDVDWYNSDETEHNWYMSTSLYGGGSTDSVTINSSATYYPAVGQTQSTTWKNSAGTTVSSYSINMANTTTATLRFGVGNASSYSFASSNSNVATAADKGSGTSSYRNVTLTAVGVGTCTITGTAVYNGIPYKAVLNVTVTNEAASVGVTIYRENWDKFRYRSKGPNDSSYGSWSSYVTGTYTKIYLQAGATLDVDWYNSDGTSNCYNMVTSSGYPGGGSDSVTIGSSDVYYYPATAKITYDTTSFYDTSQNVISSTTARSDAGTKTVRIGVSGADSYVYSSSDSSIATAEDGGAYASGYRNVTLNIKKPGVVTITGTVTTSTKVYTATLTLTVNPVCRVYRSGWNYFGKYGDTMYTSTYEDFEVAYNGSLNVVWYKVSGSKSYPYCENMVETNTYPGGGSDSYSNITSNRTFYPATAMPRTYTLAVSGTGSAYAQNVTKGTTSGTVSSGGSLSIDAYDGDSIRIYMTPGTGQKLTAIKYGSSVLGTTSPYTFTVDSSIEGKTLTVYFDTQTFDVSISPNTSSYGGVSQSSMSSVPYGSSISASGNQITVNGTTITATPTDFNRTYTYEFSYWTVNGTTLASGSSTTVTQTTTIKAVFTRRTTTYTEVSSAWWADRDSSTHISSKTGTVGSTIQLDVHYPVLWANADASARITDSSGNDLTTYAEVDSTSSTAYVYHVNILGKANGSCYVRAEWKGTTGYNYSMLPLSVIKYWSVSTSCNTGGTITASDTQVAQGSSKTVSWSSNSGYSIYSVEVDGVSKPITTTTWTFSDITADHSVVVKFVKLVMIQARVGSALNYNSNSAGDGYVNSSAKWTVHDSGNEYQCTTLVSGLTFRFSLYESSAYSIVIQGTPAQGTVGTYENVAYESGTGKIYRLTVIVENAQAHTIALDKGDGGTSGTAQVKVGDSTLTILTSPQRDGYDLLYYSMYNLQSLSSKVAEIDGTLLASKLYDTTYLTDANGEWAYDGDWTLYAIWQVKTFTVTFDANGGTCSEVSRVVTYGETYNEDGNLPIPTRAGYSFLGWFTDAVEGSRILGSDTVGTDAERTLYAHWGAPTKIDLASAWSVNGYRSDGGEIIDQPLVIGKGATKRIYWQAAYDLSSTGQADRWASSNASVATVVDVGSSTVYKWSADVSAVDTGSSTITLTWYTVGTDSATYYYSELAVVIVPTITFYGNGGTVSTATMQTQANGTLEDLPTATWDSTHVFIGWFTQASGGAQIDLTTVFTQDTSLWAHWATGYTIVYDANGGGGGPGYEVSSDSADTHDFVIPDTVPSKSGESFYEWNVAQDGSGRGYDPGDTVQVTSASPSITLYAQYTEVLNTFVLAYVATGASNVPASQSETGSSDTMSMTVSSTVPTISGQTFAGWATMDGSSWPEYLPGSRIELSPGTTTLYAVWESGQAQATGSVDNVRIFKTIGGAYIDISDRLAVRSTIHEVENYGATATFTLVNDFGNNLLSSPYGGWSDNSTGALSTGMFVQIRDTDENGFCWGTFMIMSLDVSDDLITVTCGDYIQVLRATGAEYYRNIYNTTGYQHGPEMGELAYQQDNPTKYAIVISRPSGVSFIGGGDVKYAVPVAVSRTTNPVERHSSSSLTSIIYLGASGSGERITGLVGIEGITLYLKSAAGTRVYYTVELYGGASATGTPLESWSPEVLGSPSDYQAIQLSCSEALDLRPYTYITLTVSGYYVDSNQHVPYISIRTATGGVNDSTSIGGTNYPGEIINCELAMLQYENATGNNIIAGNDTLYEITGTTAVSTIDGTLISSWPRAWVQYQDAHANLSMDTVMRTILEAPGASLTAIYSTKEVNMFRCGGDDYHAYLLALADMEDDGGVYEGRQHAFCASTIVWSAVSLGARYRADDTSQKSLYYGGDTAISGGQVMKSFNPSLTKTNRPMLAMSKGTMNDGTSIMVAVKDPSAGLGASTVVMGSSVTSNIDAAFQAYSQIMTNRSLDWEGDVELSGIHSEYMMRSGAFIGGVPIRISDSRYGMNSYPGRVKECTMDYQNLITTLVLNNYSEMYANSIIEADKMAYQAGNMAVVSDTTDLYYRQYVFLESSQVLPTASTYTMTIRIYTDFDTESYVDTTVNADVIQYPELGVATVVAMFPYGNDYTTEPYAVTQVQVNGGTAISIPTAWRPDRFASQFLIVNVQMVIQ